MFAIDNATAAASLPTPAAAGTPGYFTGGNPGAGTPATIVTADWMNMVQGELLAILAAAGEAESKTTFNQVLTSLEALFAPLAGSSGQVFSVANAVSAHEAVALQQVQNTAPIGAANATTGTSCTATTATFTAPSTGIAVATVIGNCTGLNASAVTVASSLSGTQLAVSLFGESSMFAIGYLPMTAGQTSTFTGVIQTSTSTGQGLFVYVQFLPLG